MGVALLTSGAEIRVLPDGGTAAADYFAVDIFRRKVRVQPMQKLVCMGARWG
jgi:hypothetical protein